MCKNNNIKGFTLIELFLLLGIFSIVSYMLGIKCHELWVKAKAKQTQSTIQTTGFAVQSTQSSNETTPPESNTTKRVVTFYPANGSAARCWVIDGDVTDHNSYFSFTYNGKEVDLVGSLVVEAQ